MFIIFLLLTLVPVAPFASVSLFVADSSFDSRGSHLEHNAACRLFITEGTALTLLSLPCHSLTHSLSQSATADRLAHVASLHRGVYRMCIRHDALCPAVVPHLRRLSRLRTVLVDSSGTNRDKEASLVYVFHLDISELYTFLSLSLSLSLSLQLL